MTREMKELRSKKWEVQLCILPTWELNFLCNYFSVPRNLRYGYLEEGRGEWVGGSELLGATIGLAKKTRSDWRPDCQKWTWRNFYLQLLWAWLATQCVSHCCSGFTRCRKKKKGWPKEDGSTGKATCLQHWQPEFIPCKPWGQRQEQTHTVAL